jgi:pyruvate,water dikinase
MAEKWIYWFEEIGKEQNDIVGKKCANLGEMTKMR